MPTGDLLEQLQLGQTRPAAFSPLPSRAPPRRGSASPPEGRPTQLQAQQQEQQQPGGRHTGPARAAPSAQPSSSLPQEPRQHSPQGSDAARWPAALPAARATPAGHLDGHPAVAGPRHPCPLTESSKPAGTLLAGPQPPAGDVAQLVARLQQAPLVSFATLAARNGVSSPRAAASSAAPAGSPPAGQRCVGSHAGLGGAALRSSADLAQQLHALHTAQGQSAPSTALQLPPTGMDRLIQQLQQAAAAGGPAAGAGAAPSGAVPAPPDTAAFLRQLEGGSSPRHPPGGPPDHQHWQGEAAGSPMQASPLPGTRPAQASAPARLQLPQAGLHAGEAQHGSPMQVGRKVLQRAMCVYGCRHGMQGKSTAWPPRHILGGLLLHVFKHPQPP